MPQPHGCSVKTTCHWFTPGRGGNTLAKPRPQSSSPPPMRCPTEPIVKRLASRLDSRACGSSALVGPRPSSDMPAFSKRPQESPASLVERQREQSLTLAMAVEENERLTQAVHSESAALASALQEKAAMETRNAAILEESRAREEALESRHAAVLEELQARIVVEEESSRELAIRLEALQHTTAVLDALFLTREFPGDAIASESNRVSSRTETPNGVGESTEDAAVENELRRLREECASFRRQNEELVQSHTELEAENKGLILGLAHKHNSSSTQGPLSAPCPRHACAGSESACPTSCGCSGSGCSSGCSDSGCDSCSGSGVPANEDLVDNSKALEALLAGNFATQELRQTVESFDEKLQKARRALMARESRERCLAYKELCRSIDGDDSLILEDAIRVARAVGVGAESLAFAEARLAQLQLPTREQDVSASVAESPTLDPSSTDTLTENEGSVTLSRHATVLPPLSTRPGVGTVVPSSSGALATEPLGQQEAGCSNQEAPVAANQPVACLMGALHATLPAAPPSTPAVPAAGQAGVIPHQQ